MHVLLALHAHDPVSDVVADGGGSAQCTAQLPGGNNGGTALLHGGDELAVEVLVVVNSLADALAGHSSVVHIRVPERKRK